MVVSDKAASNADNIIFSTEPGVLDNAQVFSWVYISVGWVMERESVMEQMEGVVNEDFVGFQ